MTFRAFAGSSLLASVLAVLGVALLAGCYWMVYARSAEELARTRAAYRQISWVATAEPDWRKEYTRRLDALKIGADFFTAASAQDGASAFQSKMRQSLAGTGATIDSLQSSASASTADKLPMIRAVATARITAARVVDVLQAVEAIQPRIAIEGLDIAIQTAGSPQAPERIATMTITARAYVMINADALN